MNKNATKRVKNKKHAIHTSVDYGLLIVIVKKSIN